MPTIKYKPTSPSRRHMTAPSFEEVTKFAPEKSLIEIKKKPSGDCNQRKIDQYISPGTGPETEKGHDQADHSTSQGEDVEQPDTEIQGGAE